MAIPHITELIQRPSLVKDLLAHPPPVPRLRDRPPFWREGGRTGMELSRLLRHPVYRTLEGVPEGNDRPVLLIPGFLAGDNTLGTMTQWLRRAGYRTSSAGISSNVNCSEKTAQRLEARVERLVEKTGQPATIIGQSRGGVLARVVAVRRPDLVESIVALGSPQVDMLNVHPLVLGQVVMMGALGTLGLPGVFKHSCLLPGGCCEQFDEDHRAAFPDDVRYVSVYSKSDGIVRWQSCLDPAAECVEVSSSHCGMAVSAPVYHAIADVLAEPCKSVVRPRRSKSAARAKPGARKKAPSLKRAA